jgi:hypothetical protein
MPSSRGGYESNPIAIHNNVVSKLFEAINATMDEEIQLKGAAQLSFVSRLKCPQHAHGPCT